jgi:hypothetical protein
MADERIEAMLAKQKRLEQDLADLTSELEELKAEREGTKLNVFAIKDTWNMMKINAIDGTFRRKYPIGAYKVANFGPEGLIRMQLVQMTDKWAHFMAMDALKFPHRMNAVLESDMDGNPVEGTGACGGWLGAELREYLNTAVLHLLESDAWNSISDSGRGVLWVPSEDEVFGDEYERFPCFPDKESRIRRMSGREKPCTWWLNNGMGQNSFECVCSDGMKGAMSSYQSIGVTVGFSIRLSGRTARKEGE